VDQQGEKVRQEEDVSSLPRCIPISASDPSPAHFIVHLAQC